MTRQELYKSMEREKIIMSDRLRKRLDQTDLSELHARWIGVLDLANEHKPFKRRADWLAKIFWNSTALTVGEDELARREAEKKRIAEQQAEQKRKKLEEELRQQLSEKKLAFWHSCSSAEQLEIAGNYSRSIGGFFQEFVEENYLDDLSNMSDNSVLMFFWSAIPPFSLTKETESVKEAA